jgi:calcineurin-like phosphoesterase family protein
MIKDDELHRIYIEHLKTVIRLRDKTRPVCHEWKMFDRLGEFMMDHNDVSKRPNGRVWIWSDTHFWHDNIIRYSDRPFLSIEEMNDIMLRNHNELVGPDDMVFWLGDFGFGQDDVLNRLLEKFNGYKILILGNHDVNRGRLRELEFDEIHVSRLETIGDVQLALTHFPVRGLPRPVVNVHGHEHSRGRHYTGVQHLNVCCELTGYRPRSWDDVVAEATERRAEMVGTNP